MISLAVARKMLESGQRVSITRILKSGEIRHEKECECLSSHFETNSFKVKLFPSKDIQTVKAVSLLYVNDEEVAL